MQQPTQSPRPKRFLSLPTTGVAWWAVTLSSVFIVMFAVNSFVLMQQDLLMPWARVFLIAYGFAMLLSGLAAGVLTLIALIRLHERSWLVWIPLLPAIWVLFLLAGEFLGPPH
jgi:hypothetical protein